VKPFWLVLFLTLGLACPIQAGFFVKHRPTVNDRLCGYLVDHTSNHGHDNRIWSPALGQKRDVYVYLPPGFDPRYRYPVLIWLHGIASDEQQFVAEALEPIDQAMAVGRMPPVLIVIPDGTLRGIGGTFATHTSFLNTKLGRFEDYLMCDLWPFVLASYPVHPDRNAHILAGVSLGGGSAYHHAIKYRQQFGSVVGIFPPLNVRWLDCRNRYFGDFDPNCWGWRERIGLGHEPVGKFGPIKIPIRKLVFPLYGRGKNSIAAMSRDNPLEMLIAYNVQPNELAMFVAYGKKDEFNMDAQIESFLYVAHQRGLEVTALYDPNGRHDLATAKKFLNPVIDWLASRMAPFAPPSGEG
jgi:S-formylglutathione hydrolase FrmB